ncbi:MAG: response regulator [Verrucomicrobiales bacterium]|jgi:signal transduction histidine kinase|nr:response regulator [Verrucomicrobiales bacterium]
MHNGEGDKKNLLEALHPIWVLDALLFWAIFTGFTVLMMWLLTGTTRNLLHDTAERITTNGTNMIAATLTPEVHGFAPGSRIAHKFAEISLNHLQNIQNETQNIRCIALLRLDGPVPKQVYQTHSEFAVSDLFGTPEFIDCLKQAEDADQPNVRHMFNGDLLVFKAIKGWQDSAGSNEQNPVLVVVFNGAALKKPLQELNNNNSVAILVAVLVGTILGWFILKRNMQRSVMLQKLRESGKMEALGRMAGGVAHEFNNLLHIISGNLGLMLKSANSPDDANNQAIAKRILEATDRGSRIVDQLLSSTRQSATLMTPGSLNELAEKTVALFRSGVRKDCFFHLALQPGLPAVSFDESQIQQVILNLLFNAADAVGSHGNITVRTGLYEERRPLANRQLVFCEVSDDGAGIPEELLEKIFDPFFTTKTQGKGTGLGLSMCRGILEQHGGWIKAANGDAGGARFTFYLPEPAHHGEPPPAREITHATVKPPVLGHVLLADDEPYCLDIIRSYLEEKDCRLYLARDGREALFFADKYREEIDWVITDWTMPGMEGPELVRELRKILPRAKILVVSGFGLTAGDSPEVDGWIQKPFSPSELYETLQKFARK